jgi:perosamine synthetase
LDRHLRALGEDRRRIKAVIVADLLGHVGVTPELSLLCEEFGLKLIEDGAQALGSMTAGFQADVMTLSFNNNKIVTTTGGGAVLTNDAELAERVRHLATTAKKDHPHRYDYDAVGHNYRLPNVLAAIGVPQLARLEQIIARKHRLHQRYVAAFTNVSGFKLVSHGVSSNAWLNCVLVDPPHGNGTVRDMMLAALTRAGFGCRAMFTPMHMLEPYKGCPRQDDLGIAEEIFYRAVCLPSGVEP